MLTERPECAETTTVSKIKVEEHGKKAVFVNPDRRPYLRVQVDGCWISEDIACDWFVVDSTIGGVFVELKGKDVERALQQIEAAMKLLKESHSWPMRVAGLIVCGGRPKAPAFDTRLQRMQQQLLKKYKAPLHIVCGNYEYKLDNVLSFQGPGPFP